MGRWGRGRFSEPFLFRIHIGGRRFLGDRELQGALWDQSTHAGPEERRPGGRVKTNRLQSERFYNGTRQTEKSTAGRSFDSVSLASRPTKTAEDQQAGVPTGARRDALIGQSPESEEQAAGTSCWFEGSKGRRKHRRPLVL